LRGFLACCAPAHQHGTSTGCLCRGWWVTQQNAFSHETTPKRRHYLVMSWTRKTTNQTQKQTKSQRKFIFHRNTVDEVKTSELKEQIAFQSFSREKFESIMGRVAKYKKVKSFDPYSKKNKGKVNLDNVGIWGFGENGHKEKKKSRRAEMLKSKTKKGKKALDAGFDLPPQIKDEFDITDMVGTIKTQKAEKVDETFESQYKKVATATGPVASIPETDREEKKMQKFLKVESNLDKAHKEKAETTAKRVEGESKRAYKKRMQEETKDIIRQDRIVEKNPERRERKKEFLKNKKNKKRKATLDDDDSDADVPASYNDNDDGFITGEQAVKKMGDQVRFGEQAERPPVFRQLPRGAKAKAEPSKKAPKGTKPGMTSEQVEAESNAMDIMRRKIQAQYALIKAKRKADGDFHL
jgi:hypothetical protein